MSDIEKFFAEEQEYIEDYKKRPADDMNYVPSRLYHGSPNSLEVINPKESTQPGKTVYATDDPMHALFFTIFRNSSQVRAHIYEKIDESGEYQVIYELDERYEGALEETLKDNEITIHVCDGSDFYKPIGAQYIPREWISKEGKAIAPIERISISPKKLITELNEKELVRINPYNKSKDWETVIQMLTMNYPYRLDTTFAINNPEEFERQYDEYIQAHFPEQFDFSKRFRPFVKKIMREAESKDEALMRLETIGENLLENGQLNIELFDKLLSGEDILEPGNHQNR